MPLARILALLVVLVASLGGAAGARAAGPNVAAASDLQFALPEIAALFHARTGRNVQLVFGSSGNLRRQIAEGAPIELFLSADEGFVAALQQDGRTQGEAPLYAIGRLALFIPAGSPLEADGTLADLRAALADGRLRKLAIANPEHAPYGRAAREALLRTGAWEGAAPHLVLGENVSQAAQFAASGGAQAAIVAYSLVLDSALAGRGRHALLRASLHEPLRQRMTLVKGAGADARAFFEFLQQPAARAIFRRHGFLLPDE